LISYLILRLWKSPVKKLLYCIIIFYPTLEVIFYVRDVLRGGSVFIPDYAFFLTCNSVGVGHMFQAVLLWFMPVYCLLLTADDCINDYKTGSKNILVLKSGNKVYVKSQLIKSFFCTFTMVIVALLVNLIMVHIIFYGGKFDPYDDGVYVSDFYQWEVDFPLLANILFSLITAFFCGLISMVGTINAICIKDRKIVYGLTMLMWFIPFLKEKSMMLLFQPHSEYVLNTLIPVGLEILLVYGIYIGVGYYREVYYGKDII